MRHPVQYEWDWEMLDDAEDIIDHCVVGKPFPKPALIDGAVSCRLVLVRDEIEGGVTVRRLWAYWNDGMPETFEDAFGIDSGVRVPKKYRNEVSA